MAKVIDSELIALAKKVKKQKTASTTAKELANAVLGIKTTIRKKPGPKKKRGSATAKKKTTARKTTAKKKTAAKRTPAKKKTTARKTTARKTTAKKKSAGRPRKK